MAWFVVARVAVEWPWLRRAGIGTWLAWGVAGAVVVPVAVLLASAVLAVKPAGKAFLWTMFGAEIATVAAIAVLFRDFAAFAILGGIWISAVASAFYVLGTSRGDEAWRDGNLR